MKKKAFALSIIVFVLDQVSKLLVETFISPTETVLVIKNFFSLSCVYNTGAAFSILEGKVWFLTGLSIIILIILLSMHKEFMKNNHSAIAFALLQGGILGNLCDRLFLGTVRDFLSFRILGYNFPVFNVADVCIVIGIGILLIDILKGEDKSGNSSKRRRNAIG